MPDRTAIPFNDLRHQLEFIQDELIAKLGSALGTNISSDITACFESTFAEFCGVAHALSVGSVSEALNLSLRSLDIKSGDEVIMAPNNGSEVAYAVIRAGAKPVFADIDAHTYLIDTAFVEDAITKRIKAVIAAHTYGQPADMIELRRVAKDYDIAIIEDASSAAGAVLGDARVGSFGDIAICNMGAGGTLNCCGEGAMVLAGATFYERVAEARGSIERERGHMHCLNPLQAAVLSVKLAHLDRWNTVRRYNARLYNERLVDTRIQPPTVGAMVTPVFSEYVVRVQNRDELHHRLTSCSIETRMPKHTQLHLHPEFDKYGYRPGMLPVAERIAGELLSLPLYPELSEAKIDRVASELLRCTAEQCRAA
ncbi:MAG TPA: DegT/DnrJ/EryC1/StrS family aminotransferase [Candidatus Aquicultor sp.]|jgi:dTDP-4-amino-4,6-dideoxygalactose transaminase